MPPTHASWERVLMKDSWKASWEKGPTLKGNHPWKDFTPPWKEPSTLSPVTKNLIGWQVQGGLIRWKQPANKFIKTPTLRNTSGNPPSQVPWFFGSFVLSLCSHSVNLALLLITPSGLPPPCSKQHDRDPRAPMGKKSCKISNSNLKLLIRYLFKTNLL